MRIFFIIDVKHYHQYINYPIVLVQVTQVIDHQLVINHILEEVTYKIIITWHSYNKYNLNFLSPHILMDFSYPMMGYDSIYLLLENNL